MSPTKQQQQPAAVRLTGLEERAMLVDLTVHRWTGRRRDDEVTQDVAKRNGAASDVGRYNKKLLPQNPDEFGAVGAAASEIQRIHKSMTLPWSGNGWRILPRDMHGDYATQMTVARSRFEEAVAELVRSFPRLQTQAKQLLGQMYRGDDYPKVSDLLSAHGIQIEFMPVPTAGDFRLEIDAGALTQIKADYEKHMRQHLEQAQADAWGRISSALTGLIEACDRVDAKVRHKQKTGEPTLAIMRGAVVDNIADVVSKAPMLNVGQDANLTSIATEVGNKVGKLKIDGLRTDPKARADARKAAQDILKKMAAFMPGGPK